MITSTTVTDAVRTHYLFGKPPGIDVSRPRPPRSPPPQEPRRRLQALRVLMNMTLYVLTAVLSHLIGNVLIAVSGNTCSALEALAPAMRVTNIFLFILLPLRAIIRAKKQN